MIGGGDFPVDRIIPDCVRVAMQKQEIIVCNPYSIKSYQIITVYLMIAQKQYEDAGYAGNYNVGPDEVDCCTTGELVTLFCDKWNQIAGDADEWRNVSDERFHEASFLKLDNSKIKKVFAWRSKWNIEYAVEKVVEWTVSCLKKEDICQMMCNQIDEFMAETM